MELEDVVESEREREAILQAEEEGINPVPIFIIAYLIGMGENQKMKFFKETLKPFKNFRVQLLLLGCGLLLLQEHRQRTSHRLVGVKRFQDRRIKGPLAHLSLFCARLPTQKKENLLELWQNWSN